MYGFRDFFGFGFCAGPIDAFSRAWGEPEVPALCHYQEKIIIKYVSECQLRGDR